MARNVRRTDNDKDCGSRNEDKGRSVLHQIDEDSLLSLYQL